MTECVRPFIRCFTLNPMGHNVMSLQFQHFGLDGIYAYWLPWSSHIATTLQLGSEAKFLFTSHLTNCRFSVLERSSKHPIVAHVAGDLSSSAQRNKAEKDASFGIGHDSNLVRRLSISDSRERRPFGSKTVIPKKHNYTGQTGLPENYSSAFVFGYRDSTGIWKFDAQVVKGVLTGGNTFTTDIQPVEYLSCI